MLGGLAAPRNVNVQFSAMLELPLFTASPDDDWLKVENRLKRSKLKIRIATQEAPKQAVCDTSHQLVEERRKLRWPTIAETQNH